MLVKPSLYSAVKPDGQFHTLWEAEDHTLFLPWQGIVGDCFPADHGYVRVANYEIQVPYGSLLSANPKWLIVDDVPHDQYVVCCRKEADPSDPIWLKHARQAVMTTTYVTFVEHLVCRGVGPI